MTSKLIFLTNPIHPLVHAEMETFARVSVAKSTRDEDLIAGAREASIVVVRTPIPAALYDQTPNLLGVIRHGAGVDMIPIPEATARGIAVANAPGTNAVTVAEFAVGQMLSLAHRSAAANQRMRASGWASARSLADDGLELAGKKVGLVGLGAIGQAVAKMCHFGFGMSVCGYRPSGRASLDFIEVTALQQVLAQADFVVLACPLNDSTKGLISRELLGKMKASAYLINVARGAVVDQQALVEALTEKRLAGAALDVFTQQPLPIESSLYGMENVLLSPHMAGVTDDSLRAMGSSVARQARQILGGQLPEHLVNHEAASRVQQHLALRLNQQ
ncbi:MAG: NAD(P)-dependent oxidoreductase [Alcaligenaceae bacterium]